MQCQIFSYINSCLDIQIGTGGIIDVLRYRPTNGLREFGYIDPSYADPDEEALFTYTNPKSDIAINQQNKYAYNYTNAISSGSA